MTEVSVYFVSVSQAPRTMCAALSRYLIKNLLNECEYCTEGGREVQRRVVTAWGVQHHQRLESYLNLC